MPRWRSYLLGVPSPSAEGGQAAKLCRPVIDARTRFPRYAWRVRFGKSQALVGLASATSIAALERDCATGQDFADRVIALGDVLSALSISDSGLFGPSDLSGHELLTLCDLR
jgi:hypothetical protein